MGCVSSKEAKLEAVANANGDNKKTDKDNKNASPEAPAAAATSEPAPPILKSTPNCHDNNTNSTCTHEISCGGNGSLGTFQYACWSKQGKDPDCTDKPNQDSFSVSEKFVQQNGDLFWGVYDGHGKTGAECSQFVRDRLPPLISKYLEEDHFDLILSTEQIHSSLKKAHLEVNQQLHDATDIDDAYSGTTSISVYLQGSASRITISNVGDSRAILGTQLPNNNNPQNNNNKLMPIPLSKDQTPRRPEEAQRCKQAGARILSFGQINGDDQDDDDEEDPPRVWAATGHYPGTAFTRSLGDHIAEKLGVSGEPEIMSLKLTENEKVVVLATDGIFDVLTNQEILDLCQAHNHDPLAACKAIVERSHEEWLQNEDCEADCDPRASYDDMTLICIFLHKFWEQANNNKTETTAEQQQQPEAGKKRRVRQKTLRNLEEMGGGEEQ